jgi:hypothetical protein
MERKIGETFNFGGHKYKVKEVAVASCNNCDLWDVCSSQSWNTLFGKIGYCSGYYRTDGKNVNMKRL